MCLDVILLCLSSRSIRAFAELTRSDDRRGSDALDADRYKMAQIGMKRCLLESKHEAPRSISSEGACISTGCPLSNRQFTRRRRRNPSKLKLSLCRLHGCLFVCVYMWLDTTHSQPAKIFKSARCPLICFLFSNCFRFLIPEPRLFAGHLLVNICAHLKKKIVPRVLEDHTRSQYEVPVPLRSLWQLRCMFLRNVPSFILEVGNFAC